MIGFIRKILVFCEGYAARIRIAFVFSFFKSLCMKAPVVLAYYALIHFREGTMSGQVCGQLALAMGASVILQIICAHIANVLQAGTGYLVMAEKRLRLGEHLRRLPMGYFTAGNIGKISSVLSSDMVFLEENGMTVLADIMNYIFSEAVMVIMLFCIHPWLGLAGLAIIAVICCVSRAMRGETIRDSAVMREQSENLTEAVLSFAEGIGTIKSYNLLGERSKELTDNFARSCEKNIAFERHQSVWQRWLQMLYGVGAAAVLLAALWLENASGLSAMMAIGLLLFVFDVFQPIRQYNGDAARLAIMGKCIDRIEEVLQEPELSDAGTQRMPAPGGAPEIEFRNVSFGYGETEVLHQVSFSQPRNTLFALVGPSGGGKTTIANLLARFWDVQKGSVLVRGVDVRRLPLGTLMAHISMVFQNVYLFHDTIYNNIAMGRPDASREEVIEAAKQARCYDFIMALPDGFDTMVGEGGANLSGGERQRISIARCILKDAPIVILDEATANVDADNESYIQEAISSLCRGKTLLVIAHRLNTIFHADRILVVERGAIVQAGRHEELAAQEGVYRRFVAARSGGMGWNRR